MPRLSPWTNRLRLSTNLDLESGDRGGIFDAAVAASREAAMRTQSMNNMKQLGLAMFLYEDNKKHFPAAAICDKDGKPLLSWRVMILPLIDQEALYKEFHLDEPWDSEHNKPLIAKIPVVFRDPHDSSSTNSSYFMLTGKGMFGNSEKGRKVNEITDGPSNTIMLVDAKRDIPWTKPEDIEVDSDPAKPLPRFGGHFVNGIFAATFADGSVRILSNSIDSKMLHALFTVAGGEVISDEELSGAEGRSWNAGQNNPAPAKPSDGSGHETMKIEFHRGENEPGKWVE